ncbi:unnamed protein product [Cylindrotheca closterium]|uniref:Exostosin GT47 domain-containing protein n=1 Tax=Cylindrotheca closterium TaxID=2856 RepID=A0AAD2GD36_9STRA|nr:unnamed protein product [Cylindrotheca closterium]
MTSFKQCQSRHCCLGLISFLVVILVLFLVTLQRKDVTLRRVAEEWWEPKPFLSKASSSSSSSSPPPSSHDRKRCPPLDPMIEQDFVGFPQNLTFGKYVAEQGRPFLTHDFWATIVDNRRTFLLRSFEAGFPSDDKLRAWIRSRPHPITLIINNNLDQSWPNEDGLVNKTSYQIILNDTNVHAVYASNARYLSDYPKLQPMPIGLKWAYKSTLLFGEPKDERAQNYRTYGASGPDQSKALFFSKKRKSTVFWRPMQARSNAATTKYVRDTPALQAPRSSIPPIVKETAQNSMVFAPAHMPQEDFFGELKKHRFVISPPGNGLDTHATWEALLCGCIPIVPRSDLDRVFDDLPVWLVDSWEEVTDASVKEKEAYFLANHEKWNWEKLYQPYWKERIHEGLCTI